MVLKIVSLVRVTLKMLKKFGFTLNDIDQPPPVSLVCLSSSVSVGRTGAACRRVGKLCKYLQN